MHKLLSINLKTRSGVYKLTSIVCGKDGSFYIPYSSNQWLKKGGGSRLVPIKYTYHASGKRSRFTAGPDKKRLVEFGEKVRVPIKKIKDSVGLTYVSLFDVNNKIERFLDPLRGKRGYDHELEIESQKYKHITLRIFLAEKSFLLNKPSRKYVEVFRFPSEEVDVVVTTEDYWLGKLSKF